MENKDDPPAPAVEFAITRVFDAPRALVFRALTEVDRLAQWWGPKGFTMVRSTLDLRPGGRYHYLMRSPDGHEMWGRFSYLEVDPPARIVFTNSFSDAAGNAVRAPFSPTWPLEVRNVLTLEERDGKTSLTLRGAPYRASAEEIRTFDGHRPSMQQGFGGTLDQLEEYLKKPEPHLPMNSDANAGEDTSAREIVATRLFAAPRALVFRMWTEPEHIVHWWGPQGFTDTIKVMDVRPGGRWSHVMHGPDGVDYPNESVYVEVTPPERLVFDHFGPDFRMTVTFEEKGAATQVTMQLLFPTAEIRDRLAINHGAVEGARQHLAKLGDYLATLPPPPGLS